MIQIYCGDGKGKTTAAVGQAVRAAGRGRKVLIARFLKTEDSGEVAALRRLPGVFVFPCERTFGFTFQMTEETRREAAAYYEGFLERVIARAKEEQCDMLVLDEVIGAENSGMTLPETLTAFLETCPADMEVVLTGRNPSARLLEMADYVSEIQAVRHPYSERGIPAREGIEY